MRRWQLLAVLATATGSLAVPRPVVGQAQTVTCESADGRRRECSVSNVSKMDVSLDEQLSKADCERDRTWGVSSRGVWVDGGCRARFAVRPRGEYGQQHGGSKRQELTCESARTSRQSCPANGLIPTSVRLERRLSDSPCTNGRTWGTERGSIWVDEGCRATFSYETSGSGGNEHGAGRREITCESDKTALRNCRVSGLHRSSVRLVRQLSDSPCVSGRSWGTKDNAIWVDDGCRGVFSYTSSESNSGGGTSGRREVTCESSGGSRQTCQELGFGVDPNSVKLERQLSESACVKGRTWGLDGGGLWVKDGCRAVFSYRSN